GAMARPKQLRPTGACDLLRAAPRAPGGRRGSPCAHEIRGGACGRACWAGKCASRHRLQRRLPGLSGGRYIGDRSGQVNDGPGWCSWRREEFGAVTEEAIIAAADAAARRWAAPVPGSIRPGSELHKITFCNLLLDTHNPYKPAVIEWPRLDEEARARLVGLPIW